MKLALRLLLGLAALLVLAVIALAIALPRLAQRPEVRDEIARAALERTGRELRFGELDAGILPPRLIVASPELIAREGEAPLRADRISLSLALLPLLAGRIGVDTVTLEGADLTFARTPNGFELPVQIAAAETPEAESSVDLTVGEVRVSDSRVALADRIAVPETVWQLEDVAARASGSLTGRITFDAEAKLASGGELAASGKLDDGELGLQVKLAGFALAAAKAYFPEDAAGAGEADFELDLSGPTDALAGPLSGNLDAAQLDFGDSFRKPAGETLRITGTLALRGDDIALEDGSLALRDLETPLAVTMADKTSATLAGGSLELAGWDAILPALEGLGLTGKLSFERLAVGMDPLSLRGTIGLDEVALPLAEGQNAVVSMKLEGSGDAIRGSGPLTIGGQKIELALGVTRLSRDMQLTLNARAKDLDSGAVATAFGAPKDSLSGPLDLDAKLAAPLGGEAALVDALSGPLTLEIAPGRMPGVSLFRNAIDALGGVASAAALFGKQGAGSTLEKFYEDEFESLGGTFTLGGGKATTDDLALLYRDYRVDLTGDVALADTALDLEGTLTIYEAIDQAIAGAATTGEAATAAPTPRAVKRELPLAHVGGTANAPSVSISPKAALAFTTAYLGGGKLREKLDESVPGAGDVLDALGGFLGGKKKEESE
ncbi:MAG TPA: DUF748 domain-containing protein [Myxococcota bacterium]|nr:DUF748 domain-containing protein [Myxococcota bacterium]